MCKVPGFPGGPTGRVSYASLEIPGKAGGEVSVPLVALLLPPSSCLGTAAQMGGCWEQPGLYSYVRPHAMASSMAAM